MSNLCFSSEIYPLLLKDLLILPDSQIKIDDSQCNDDIILLIGDEKKQTKDSILHGKEALEQAVAKGHKYVPVRIAFETRTSKYDILSPLIRSMRYKHKSFSLGIYHTDPFEIRKLKIERKFRTKENEYKFTKKKYRIEKNTRRNMYEDLYNSMKKKRL